MAQWVVRKWGGGVDTRRPIWDADSDVLLVGNDVVLTNDGQIEKRKRFVSKYDLPATQTFGLMERNDELFVVGTLPTPSPAVPSGVAYHQVTPNGSVSVVRVLSWDLFDGKFYIAARMTDGSTQHFYDGAYVSDWFDGRSRGSFAITGGTSGGGNQVSSVRVNGVEVLNTPVAWATSNVDTAEAVATQINSYTSSPDYTAVAVNGTVIIAAEASVGAGANGFLIEVTAGGTVTVGSIVQFANGTEASSTTPGDYVKTIDDKIYSPSEKYLNFSGVNQPTKFNPDTLGAGFINMASHASGAEQQKAVVELLDRVLVVARRVSQMWFIDPDPENYEKAQVLKNVGTEAARSVGQFRDVDVLMLADSGPIAVRVTGNAEVNAGVDDIGAPIATDYAAIRASITDTVASEAIHYVEPVTKRWWFCIGEYVLVLNYYPERKVSGWTIWNIGFQIEDVVTANRRTYARSGDTIYLLGGDDNATYYEGEAVVRMPALQLSAPANYKGFQGYDYGVEGLWEVKVFTDEKDTTGVVQARVFEPTFNKFGNPSMGGSTHGFLEFRSKDSGYASIRSVIVHFERDDAEVG